MNRYPPVLADVVDASCGSILVLNDGQRISLNISRGALQDYLAEYDFPTLSEICRFQNATVFHRPLGMSANQWLAISNALCTSPNAAQLREFTDLHNGFKLSYAQIQELPFRLYGGVGQCVGGCGPNLYTSHPLDFHPDGTRELPWYYWLLNARGGHIFKTYVNIQTSTVDFESGVIQNHFVEPELKHPA